MKKKMLIFILFFMIIPAVFAESEIVGTTTDRCSIDEAGNINIVWTGDKESVGKTNITYCDTESYEKHTYYYENFKVCQEKRKEICPDPICKSGSKNNVCSGKTCSPCIEISDEEKLNCDNLGSVKVESVSGSTINNRFPTLKAMKNVSVYEDGASGSSNKNNNNSNSNGNNNINKKGNSSFFNNTLNPILTEDLIEIVKQDINNITNTITQVNNCVNNAKFSEMGQRLKQDGKCDNKGLKELYAGEYTIKVNGFEYSGDTVYCLQPDAAGPDTPQTYTLDTTFNISNCEDSLHLKDGSNDVRCGLAHILYETVTYDSKTNTYKDNGKYSYGAITFALRLWMAEYAEKYGRKNDTLGSVGNYNNEFNDLDWAPSDDSKNDYYRKTSKEIVNSIVNNKSYNYSSDEQGLIVCKNASNCSFKQSVELFTSAYKAAFTNKSSFLKGIDFSEEVPVVRTYQSSKTEIKTIVEIPESISKNRTCSEDDYNKGKCYVKIKYFDENGKDITDKVKAKGSCGKEFCTITREIVDLCEENKVSITTKVYIDGWQRNNGYIRFYTHSTNPNKYQKMITFAFNLEKCVSEEKTEIISEPLKPICQCPTSTCDDLTTTTNMPSQCGNGEYTTGTSKDPSMSCIINACHEIDKNKFDNTEKLNANSNVCKVYCRNEIELILPGQISTYAGMQFQFDLGNILNKNGKTVLANSTYKITGVLNHKQECTSEIYYEKWKEQYDTVKRSDNKKELSKWVYELLNCNLYTKDEIKNYLKENNYSDITINNTIKDLAISNEANSNKNSKTQLSVSYEKESTLSKITGLITDKVKTYYCTNNCYKNNSQITGNNNLSNKLPINEYASFTVESQTDFYESKEYQTDVLSGIVSEINGNNKDNNKTPIEKYSYPVNNNTKTGSYDINYKLTNVPTTDKKDINYSCKYDVYNRTVLYDCKITDKDGNLDLSSCSDDCYEVKNGIPVINKSCIKWTVSDKKQYGFIYRSVDLSNLFPNGLSSRNKPINWSDKLKEIENIQKTASDIFTNKDYLEYRYVLTPQTIKDIKKYNKEQSKNGGYKNNTLTDCEMVLNGNVYEFKNCKSTFINHDIKEYSGIEISGNKAGVK